MRKSHWFAGCLMSSKWTKSIELLTMRVLDIGEFVLAVGSLFSGRWGATWTRAKARCQTPQQPPSIPLSIRGMFVPLERSLRLFAIWRSEQPGYIFIYILSSEIDMFQWWQSCSIPSVMKRKKRMKEGELWRAIDHTIKEDWFDICQ